MAYTLYPGLAGTTLMQVAVRGGGLEIRCDCGHATTWHTQFLIQRFAGSLAAPVDFIAERLTCPCGEPRLRLNTFQSVQGPPGKFADYARQADAEARAGRIPVVGTVS